MSRETFARAHSDPWDLNVAVPFLRVSPERLWHQTSSVRVFASTSKTNEYRYFELEESGDAWADLWLHVKYRTRCGDLPSSRLEFHRRWYLPKLVKTIELVCSDSLGYQWNTTLDSQTLNALELVRAEQSSDEGSLGRVVWKESADVVVVPLSAIFRILETGPPRSWRDFFTRARITVFFADALDSQVELLDCNLSARRFKFHHELRDSLYWKHYQPQTLPERLWPRMLPYLAWKTDSFEVDEGSTCAELWPGLRRELIGVPYEVMIYAQSKEGNLLRLAWIGMDVSCHCVRWTERELVEEMNAQGWRPDTPIYKVFLHDEGFTLTTVDLIFRVGFWEPTPESTRVVLSLQTTGDQPRGRTGHLCPVAVLD
jgi:hypothetical protein